VSRAPFVGHSASDFVVVTPIEHRAKWAQHRTEFDVSEEEAELEARAENLDAQYEVLAGRDKQIEDEYEMEQRLAARRGWELDDSDSNETLGVRPGIQRP
jgi:hypothetical protein